MSQPDGGTITFLFTDIEGSTRLWEAEPEVMPSALARHDRVLREAIEAAGGEVFKTVGDAFCAAFPSADAAVAAALDAQRRLAAEPWPDATPIRVRAALHSGPAHARDGDYFGPTLNRTARLLAAAHGGQTLLSLATRQLLEEPLADGVDLRDLAAHRLKDLSQPEHIFQLSGGGLEADFPPVRSLEGRAHNLPLQLTSFVGRERELAEVRERLASSRLLTLTGAGGTGKTRLALQLAAEQIEEYSDGAWFTDLAPLESGELVVGSVARVLGLREEPGRTIEETLFAFLQPRSLLLVLDNCEHVVEACAQSADEILKRCAGVRILATSRERLGLTGEVVWPVPTMGIPDDAALTRANGGAAALVIASEAGRLFVERATSLRPSFELAGPNANAVGQICRRLDGIPLAIELAAARTRALSAAEVAARLDDRFGLLTGGSRSALARHRTLEAAIDWSHDLLGPPEQALFRRLAVFRGGWTVAAAAAVCAGGPVDAGEIVDGLSHLVDRSLVTFEETGGSGRYRFLETLRAYARDKLAASEEERSTSDAHLAYFLDLAELSAPELNGPRQREALETLELEHDNLRAALDHAVTSVDAPQALRLGAALVRFWSMHGHLSEGRSRLRTILALPDAKAASCHLAAALGGAGHLAILQGDYDRGRAWFAESLEICQLLGDVHGETKARSGHALVALSKGELDAAESMLREVLATFRVLGDERGVGGALTNLGYVAQRRRMPTHARAHYEEALTCFENLGDLASIATVTTNLASVADQCGDYEVAGQMFERALTLQRALGHLSGVAVSLGGLGNVAYETGDLDTARTRYEESVAIRRALGLRPRLGIPLANLGNVAAAQGDVAAARRYLAESLAVRREINDRGGIAYVLESFAWMASRGESAARAARLLAAADALRGTGASPLGAADQRRHDDALAAARTALGDVAFDQAWSEGRAMSLDEAIALALDPDGATVAAGTDAG